VLLLMLRTARLCTFDEVRAPRRGTRAFMWHQCIACRSHMNNAIRSAAARSQSRNRIQLLPLLPPLLGFPI
jgi:hypothetical protein